MFERFTSESRRAVVLAQEECRRLDHSYIGTEHLLVGLTREERGAAGRALESAGITVSAVRETIVTLVGRGQQAAASHIPFTPQAKKCLELALREALQLGHNYIGTGHVLLGLISKDDSVAVQVLGELGTDIGQLRAQVVLEIEERREDPGGSRLPPPRQLPLSDVMLGLLDRIDERLTAIERHLGIASVPAADPADPAAGAEESPGEAGDGPAAG